MCVNTYICVAQSVSTLFSDCIVLQVLCASYIDKKHRMARPQFAVDTDWKYIYTYKFIYRTCSCAVVFRYAYEEKDVVILRKEFPDTPYHWLEI